MKRKNVSSQPITKADLKSALKNVATKDDLENFATKAAMKTELKKYATREDLRTEIKLSADETVRKLEETIIDVKDILLTTMDSFAKDIENNREDRDLAIHQTEELRSKVDNHEERITNLEKTQSIT